MVRFIRYIVVMSLSFAALIFASECYLDHCIPNKLIDIRRHIDTHATDVKVLCIGNSLAENSINPHLLGDSAYSFARASRWLYYDRLLAEETVPLMPNLSCLILSFGDYSATHITDELEVFQNPKLAQQVYLYAKYLHLYYGDRPHFVSSSTLLSGELHWKTLSAGRKYNFDSRGWRVIDGQAPNWRTLHNCEPDDPACDYSPCIAQNVELIDAIAKICRDCDVRFIIVTPPVHDVYLVNTSERVWSALHQVIDSVAAHYPLEYYDYHDDPAFRADSIYYDCSHLNHAGASLFTHRLKEDANL